MVHDIRASAKELKEDLNKSNNLAFQWKINFNRDLSKQAQEVLFNRKLQKVSHTKLFFNNSDVSQKNSQKHLGVLLDSKLTFHDHLDIVFTKVRTTIERKPLSRIRFRIPQLRRWCRKLCLFLQHIKESTSSITLQFDFRKTVII